MSEEKKPKSIFEGPKQHEGVIKDKLKNVFQKKADISTDKEAGTNTYAKANQEAIKKLRG